MKYAAFNSVEIVGSVNSHVFHQNVDVKFFQVATSQWERSQPDNLVMLCKFKPLLLFICLEIDSLYGP